MSVCEMILLLWLWTKLKQQRKVRATLSRWQKQLMRNAVMTHCVGVLVVSELHQCGAVLRLPGFGGPPSALASLWACVATADRVLPRAARIARRDVLLISVCSGGGGSAPKQKTVRKWDAFSLSAAHFISVTPGQLLLETKSQGQPYTSFTYTFSGS